MPRRAIAGGRKMIRVFWMMLLLASSQWLAIPASAESEGQQLAQQAGRSLIGTSAPALVLKTIDGQTIDLRKLYGKKAVYLKFWATWCVPCRQQMPHFESTYEHAGSDLAVIAINAGFNDSVEDVKVYRKAVGLKMPIVIDDGRLADALHLRVTPQHIVIGRDGKITYIGHLVDERLEAALTAARARPGDMAVAAKPAVALTDALDIGARVPGISLTALDGSTLTLADPAGSRPTVIFFLSPWCESYLEKSRPERSAACKRAREQSARLSHDATVRWIGVASGLWSTAADLGGYRDQHQLAMPLALDESGAVFRNFGVRDVPVFILVNSKGEITGRINGATDHLDEQLSRTGLHGS